MSSSGNRIGSAALVLLGLVSCSGAPPPVFDEAQWLASEKAEDLSALYAPHENPDRISFAGHASSIIKLDGETIFTDPFFSNHAVHPEDSEHIRPLRVGEYLMMEPAGPKE